MFFYQSVYLRLIVVVVAHSFMYLSEGQMGQGGYDLFGRVPEPPVSDNGPDRDSGSLDARFAALDAGNGGYVSICDRRVHSLSITHWSFGRKNFSAAFAKADAAEAFAFAVAFHDYLVSVFEKSALFAGGQVKRFGAAPG